MSVIEQVPGGTTVADWSKRTQTLVAVGTIVAVYTLLYNLPGSGDWVKDKVPYGMLFIGGVQGTTTALLAMGLILIYRTNRFVNFAYAAMGALPGAFAIGLYLEKDVPFFAALAIAVVLGIGLGFVTELIIRRFRNSTRLIVTVASIGLAQIFGVLSLGANTAIGFLSLAGGFETPISTELDVLDVGLIRGDELLILAVVPGVIMGLAWFLLRTDAGVALRASAENEDRALLLGIPVYKLGRIVWMIAGGLAALTFVLQAPRSGVAPGVVSAGPAVLLPALAAAVVARLESLPIAFIAGVGLGMMDQLVRWNFEKPTLTAMAFLVVILIALLAQRGSLSRAMNSESAAFDASGVVKSIPRELRFLPEVRAAKWVLGSIVVLGFVLLPAGWSSSNQLLAGTAIVWATVGVSLVLLTGWGGHISLGQFAIAGMGGMLAGNLILRNDIDFFLVVLASGAAGAIVALVLGLPALRIKGLFLAVTTLAFAVALNAYVINTNNFPTIIPTSLARPFVWERWNLEDGYPMYVVCLVFLAVSYMAARSVRGTRSGRVTIATRDNERAADSASVPTTKVKLTAFVVAGCIAGMAGALHVTILHGIGVGQYAPEMSLEVFATSVIGGLGSLAGAISGVLAFQFLAALDKVSVFGLFVLDMGKVRPLISGTGLLVVLLVFPGGFAQIASRIRDRFLRIVADRRGIIVPSLVADKRRDDDHPEDETGLLAGALGGDEDVAATTDDELVGSSR